MLYVQLFMLNYWECITCTCRLIHFISHALSSGNFTLHESWMIMLGSSSLFLHGACGFGDVGDCKMLSYQLSIAIGIIGTPIHSSYYLYRFAELSCFVEFCDFYNMPFPLNTSENTSRTVEGGGDSFPAGDLGRRRRFESYSSWHSLERPWFSFDTEASLSDSGSKSSAAVQTPEAAVRSTGDI